jgi:hypothetical protein
MRASAGRPDRMRAGRPRGRCRRSVARRRRSWTEC